MAERFFVRFPGRDPYPRGGFGSLAEASESARELVGTAGDVAAVERGSVEVERWTFNRDRGAVERVDVPAVARDTRPRGVRMDDVFRLKLVGSQAWAGRPQGYPSAKSAHMAAIGLATREQRSVDVFAEVNGRAGFVEQVQPGRPSGSPRRVASSLPELFGRLSADDWRRVRSAVLAMRAGDEEALSLSVGYIDAGREPGSARGYVGANTFGPGGAGGQSYRKLYSTEWP